MRSFFLSLCSMVFGLFAFAQSYGGSPWVFEAGINAVNVYSVGEDAPQGPFFDEFFNVNDHWNIGLPTVKVARYINDDVFVSVRASFNKLNKWGEFPNDPKAEVDKLTYLGFDAMINTNINNLFESEKVEPFVGAGLGYTWIQEGEYNMLSPANGTDDLVGAATINVSAGLKYWFTETIGLSWETTYKHSFEDYLTKHWQHSLGVIFKIEDCTCY
ncbi:hypothetical protein RBH94_03140 [Aestuariibaculum sp. YM273]|uniref:outer membrane beta-barrel protein n=1 Tax=Aestuariibaculum sp. YM273 TaxID=3070659 RepID=UPI0027DE4D4F|nr:outer membrane beta-barrel protein [Aestuariibaculum sp. YM273]WMI66161.1 hypothetical protein RBH94_03140 [Aestuariibaculum sp. YM273]